MQLKSTTAPYLLMAGGAALLILALVSFRLPVFGAAAVFIGLGLWALRGADLSRFMAGSMLLWAAAAVLVIAGVVSFKLPMFGAAAVFAGLGFYARQREQSAGG
jgi:hypothetical protein